ncbi:MAG: hypothetical protein IPP44_05455 [Ideonella sp.]|jgi:hypothetical protein|nr:hypothetical protein [Ideonella sp.]
MTTKTRPNDEPVRLLFEMTRDDNPRLYDDLIRFNKGTKRVNRLRFLAHEGLLAQLWMLAPVGNGMPVMGNAVPPAPPGVNPVAARHTNHAFDAPTVGEEA